ncbi:AraC family transcriptional regulator [Paenibacillus sp. FSL R5-0345]|uniref:helix-turn-helix domain-containing protein n=1 Tax=Paenibacillus sp. FSL R5-0345 TaxID=1536770 RepID=UPI0004F912F3|nr:helix-turn-helix domain-containing protein [Paenibacillus sp. FSL R5-0345]AIQ34482.1 AraC family transcriptional regulator [Paenibacillus sp. FSL R5-0345]
MNNVIPEWAESHFPLYSAGSIQSMYGTSNLPRAQIHENLTVLLAVAAGKGSLEVNNLTYELTEGSVILLPANTHAALITNLQQPLHVYKLTIWIQEQTQAIPGGAMIRKSEIASGSNMLLFPYEPAIVSSIRELYLHRLPDRETRHIQNQMLFHQIILQLLEQQEARYTVNEQPSMERSISYLENHFSEKITREYLAAIAGVSSSHYSTLFKQVTGFSQSEYLSRLRVHSAKELLLNGSGTLREIALKVGYKDEFYLSRRFKLQTGASPSGYSRSSFQRVAVMLTPYASHLLLLGLEPAVTISESSEYLNLSDQEPPQSMKFINTNSSAEQIRSLLLEANVELIIAAKEHLEEYGLKAGQLRAVAPIMEISWNEIGWKDQLRLIGRAIQRSERAEQWLNDFEQEELEAREVVQHSTVAKAIVTILVIKPEELLVYGARNVGYVMYQSLGLRAPTLIDNEIKRLGDRFHSISIEVSDLADYAGNRILVIVFPDAKGSTAHTEAIFQSPYWSQLPAVQQKKVQLLDLDDWVPYNPASIRLQLGRAVALFGGK